MVQKRARASGKTSPVPRAFREPQKRAVKRRAQRRVSQDKNLKENSLYHTQTKKTDKANIADAKKEAKRRIRNTKASAKARASKVAKERMRKLPAGKRKK